MKKLLLAIALFVVPSAFAECGLLTLNPITGKLDCSGTGSGGGSGGTLVTMPTQTFTAVTSPQTFAHGLGTVTHWTGCRDGTAVEGLYGITVGANSDTITFSGTATFTCVAAGGVGTYTVSSLPAAPPSNTPAIVTDAATTGSCTSGGGTAKSFCIFDGTNWVAAGGGGGGSGDVTGPASSVDSEVAVYNSTTGKILKRASATGVAHLTSGVLSTSVVTAAEGGTGQAAGYAIGDILYASGSSALSKLAGVATGNALISGGVTTAPAWGKVGLTTHVSGILPGANGGTENGFTLFTGPATSAKTFTLPNATSTILTSNAAVTVAQGGTGIASGTSGGVPYFSGSTTIASSAALTANLPVIGGGAGVAPGVGTRSGSTTAFVTTTGTQTSGRCVEIDASGNHIASAAGCAAGAGTVSVVSSGSLTSTALVTGGGTTTLQTPSATSTLDSSGNLALAGTASATSFSSGGTPPTVSGGTSGVIASSEGTAPSTLAASGVDGCYADSTAHAYLCTFNNDTASKMLRASDKLSALAATTSAELASVISNETGTSLLVYNTSPTLVTPDVGVATATSINKVAITAPASSATLTIANGKTLTSSNTLTFTGTDSSSVAFGAGGTATKIIAAGTSALGTSSISTVSCATVVTTSATGVAATDVISWTPNASIKAVTGYAPSTSGGLSVQPYPTTNNVNFDVCNWTSGSITPGAVTINWQVTRTM